MDGLMFDKHISFGLTPFETIYFQNNNAELVREHYRRLVRACKVFDIKLLEYEDPAVFEQLVAAAVAKVSEVHGTNYGVVKVIASSSGWVVQGRLPSYDRAMYEAGLKLSVSGSVRDKHNIFSYFKTFNCGMSYVEDKRAKGKGFDTSLHLNQDGQICETAYANVFFVKDKVVVTPTVSSGILNGVMRDRVRKLSPALGYRVECRKISHAELDSFTECFITNSVAGVFPVCLIDELRFCDREFVKQAEANTEFTRPWNRSEG